MCASKTKKITLMPGDANQRFPGWPQFWTEFRVFGSGAMVPSRDSWIVGCNPESQRSPMGNPYIRPILTWVFTVYNPQNSHPRNCQGNNPIAPWCQVSCKSYLQHKAPMVRHHLDLPGRLVRLVTSFQRECKMRHCTHWSTTSICQDLPQNIHLVQGFAFQWDSTKMFFVELAGCMNDTSKQMDT